MSETELSAAIAKALERLGFVVIRVQSGTVLLQRPTRRMSLAAKGTPDRLVLGPGGRSLWLEVKRPGQKLRLDQKLWEEKAMRLGHVVARVDSIGAAVNAVRELL